MKTKAQMNYEIAKEQADLFIKLFPDGIYEGFDIKELFDLIKGANYRRGKEEGKALRIEELDSFLKFGKNLRNAIKYGREQTLKEEIKFLNWLPTQREHILGAIGTRLTKLGLEIAKLQSQQMKPETLDCSAKSQASNNKDMTADTLPIVYYCKKCDRYTDARYISDRQGGRHKSYCYKCHDEMLEPCYIHNQNVGGTQIKSLPEHQARNDDSLSDSQKEVRTSHYPQGRGTMLEPSDTSLQTQTKPVSGVDITKVNQCRDLERDKPASVGNLNNRRLGALCGMNPYDGVLK